MTMESKKRSPKEVQEHIEDTLEEINQSMTEILAIKRRQRASRTQLIFTTIINNFKIQILAMQLDKQKFADAILALVVTDTREPIADAVFSNIVLTSSDESIFTIQDINNDTISDVVGQSEGEATLNVKADVDYTDPNTKEAVHASKEANLPVTITAPPPGAVNTEMIVQLGAAQPVQ